jgi:hypothetical protein
MVNSYKIGIHLISAQHLITLKKIEIHFGAILYLNDGQQSSFSPIEPPRRKRRGINRKILNTPRRGELNPRPQAD